jgi:hypothetical protein
VDNLSRVPEDTTISFSHDARPRKALTVVSTDLADYRLDERLHRLTCAVRVVDKSFAAVPVVRQRSMRRHTAPLSAFSTPFDSRSLL